MSGLQDRSLTETCVVKMKRKGFTICCDLGRSFRTQ